MQIQSDGARWKAAATIQKWSYHDLRRSGLFDVIEQKVDGVPGMTGEELLLHGINPSDELTVVGNLLTTAGLTRLNNLLTGAGGQAWDATHSRIGTADATTAANVADTDLGGTSNKYFQLVSATPSVSGGVTTFVATFGTANGNYAWQEWGVDQGTASGATVTATLLNHKIVSMGTKASGASWTITATITIS